MRKQGLVNFRLQTLFVLLLGLEGINLTKLSIAFGWTNSGALGGVAAVTLGSFLVGSILALSFPLDSRLKKRLELSVTGLFVLQTTLVCVVSYLNSRALMPTADIAGLFYASDAVTQRVFAVGEGAATNVAAFAFWGVLGGLLRSETDRTSEELISKRQRLQQLVEFEKASPDGKRSSNAR